LRDSVHFLDFRTVDTGTMLAEPVPFPGMLRHCRTLSIGIAAVVIASNAAAQQPGTAGATRPKLQVLQALPEAQLFLLMNLVGESLGVRCDYCHVQESPNLTRTPSNAGGWVWDRDDKAPKRTAREMMRMVVDLNASRFRGEPRITCYTCHRGSTHPGRTPPLPPSMAGSARTPAPVPLPSADRVWTNYVNAVGQADPLARAGGTIVIAGWDDRPEGRYGKVELTLAGTDRYRATVSTPAGVSSQGLDGDVAWVTAGDRVQRLSAAADVARLRRIAMRYRPVKERPANLRIVGIERVAERDAYVATAKIDAITTQTLYFDVVTGLLRRDVTTTETLLLPLEDQVDYDDYRDVNGVQMPFRIQTSDGAPYDTITRTFLEIKRDVPVDDAVFRPPSEPR
jgi:photosynthetic reaction center cytochrome c subunit